MDMKTCGGGGKGRLSGTGTCKYLRRRQRLVGLRERPIDLEPRDLRALVQPGAQGRERSGCGKPRNTPRPTVRARAEARAIPLRKWSQPAAALGVCGGGMEGTDMGTRPLRSAAYTVPGGRGLGASGNPNPVRGSYGMSLESILL